MRAGMAVAMAASFVVALTIPEAWHDAPGGLDGPLVLVGAYLLVRCVHLTLYVVAAAGDRGLRHQLAVSWGPLLASAALLVPGALLALYLAGHLLFKQRMHGTLSLPRLVAIGVLLAALPAAIVLPPLVGVAGLVLILAALAGVETTRYAQARRSLRDA
jgi:hypothetical protein